MNIDKLRKEIATKRVYEYQLLCLAEKIHKLKSYGNLQKVEKIELEILKVMQSQILTEYNDYLSENGLPIFEGIN